MRTIRIVSVLVVTTTAVVTLAIAVRSQEKQYPARSYMQVSTRTHHPTQGAPRITQIQVRWLTASGHWKDIMTSLASNGQLQMRLLLSNSDGQYLADDVSPNLRPIGGPAFSPAAFRSTEFYRARRGLVGEGSVLGFKTFVFRSTTSQKNYIEKHYSPELGVNPIKVTIHNRDAGDTVVEAILVEFVEIAEEQVAKAEGIPVKLEVLEQAIQSLIRNAEKSGELEKANCLQRVMSDWRQRLTK